MRILIPTILSTKNKVGVTNYLIELISNLQLLDKSNEYFIITTNDNHRFFNIYSNNFYEIRIKLKEYSRIQHRLFYSVWHHFFLPRIVRQKKIDILHIPCTWFISPNQNTVVTIHDLIEVNTPKYSIMLNSIKRKLIFSSIRNAKHIISVSNATTDEIKKYRAHDITTIRNGISSPHVKQTSFDKLNMLRKYNLQRQKYFVFIGTLQHHKNLINLIRAFSLLLINIKDFKLVLIGKKDNAFRVLRNERKRLGLIDQVILTGHLAEEDKQELLINSFCLCLISFEEGFGFPVLEAQSAGIPVIASDIPSLKETSGSAAILVNPSDIIDITTKMMLLLNDTSLKALLIKDGLDNVNRFSWNENAKETIKTYEKVYNSSS